MRILFLVLIFISPIFGINSKSGQPPRNSLPPLHLVPVVERLFHTAESTQVFEDARLPEPMMIWNYFLALVEIPRPDDFPDVVVPKLIEYGHRLGLEAYEDQVRNVIIKKPASPGCENWPVVCLQTHYDIVAVAMGVVDIDFEKDPLKPRLVTNPDGQTVMKATDTSLGADNGIGIAFTFAILEDNTLKHGPLEILITKDEESSMIGAIELRPDVLSSKYMINLDGETGILIGGSGGFEETLRFPVERASVVGVEVSVSIRGLRGGHSGDEINQGRGHAFKILAEAVDVASRMTNLQGVLTMKSFVGGDRINAIPFEADTVLVMPADKVATFQNNFETEVQKLKLEWKTPEPGLEFVIQVDNAASSHDVFDADSTQKTLDLIHLAPQGVLRLSPDIEGLVETSINFCIIRLCFTCDKDEVGGGDLLHLEFFARSNDDAQQPFIHDKLVSFARVAGGVPAGPVNAYPGWLPNLDSHLLLVAKQVYKKINKVDPYVFAIHGSLETGIFQGTYPNLDTISIGPLMTDLHSPDESLYVDTVPDNYRFLIGILENLDS